MRTTPAVLALAALLAPAAAQEPRTAADVTEPVKSMGRALDVFLADGAGTERTLFVLVDATQSLKKAQFAAALSGALARAKGMEQTSLGVGHVGTKGTVVLAPTQDRAAITKAVRRITARSSKAFQNVYADLRNLAGGLKSKPGKRAILLVTLENGDAEDDLEGTVARLKRAKVRVWTVTSESLLADSYFASRPYQRGPRGCELRGGDGPFIDLPWGWTFQTVTANELTPSGFATYGLTRVTAGTGGRCFLYSPPSTEPHRCTVLGHTCLFCNGDHMSTHEVYWDARLRLLAPPAVSRKAAYRETSVNPWFRATQKAWRAAAKAGLLRSQPPRKYAGTTARDDSQLRRTIGISISMNFARNAVRARKAASDCDRIMKALEEDMARAANVTAEPRQKAMAGLTRVLLQLTKANMLTFAGWCEDVAPKLVAKHRTPPEPPELPPREKRRPTGIGWWNLCLCHGVRPFYEVDLPGGPAFRAALEKLDRLATEFLATHGHTPYAVAFHRSNIARFHLTYPGRGAVGHRPRPKSKRPDNPVTTPERGRPKRTGRTGRPTGPTTGK